MDGQGSNMDRRRESDHQDRESKEIQLKPGFLGTKKKLVVVVGAVVSQEKRRWKLETDDNEDICQNPLVRPIRDKTR